MSPRRPPDRRPPAHTVFVDTNILWHEDKSVVVNPQFEAFWDRYASLADLALRIPSVVRGELLFQHTTSACKALDRATEHLERVRAITNRTYRHRASHDQLRQSIERRFDRWLAGKTGEVVNAPIAAIDWQRVTEDSIWRRPPFVLDPSGPDNEKGFRDAVILETLVNYCDGHRSSNVVFVCNDRILRDAAEDRLSAANCQFFESLAEFGSYIELTRQRLTDSFVKAIVARARRKFFTPRKQDSLYYRDSLYASILAAHEDSLSPPPDSLSAGILARLGSNPAAEWKRVAERVLIGNPQFQRLDDPRTFHWISRITVIRAYTRSIAAGLLSLDQVEESQLIVDFAVMWHSEVRANGTFRTMGVDGIEVADRRFAPMSPEDRERYGLTKTEGGAV